MSASNLESMTLAQLVAHFNALPGVDPVKKFASKAAAIKRIEAVQPEETVETVETDEPVEDQVQPEESVETFEGETGYWTQTDDGPVWTSVEESVETVETDEPVEDQVQPEESVESVETADLTELEYRFMDDTAFHLHNTTNGAVPESAADVATWFWADEIAVNIGTTVQGVGGVASSLIQKGYITTTENTATGDEPCDATVSFTEAGFTAWKTAYEASGRPEPVNTAESVATSGFQYLTRDQLTELAETDPVARAAYRIARRKAARSARKARKAAPATAEAATEEDNSED